MCAPSTLGAPGPLAARAPGGGDSVPLISRCAKFKLPELVGRRVRAARARKLLLHLESFTLWAGEGRRKRDPRGARRGARAAGRAGADFPLRVLLPVPTSAVLGPVDEVDGQRTRQTDTCRVGWTRARVGSPGRSSRLDAPGPPRAARADARLSHGPGSARVGRGGGNAGGKGRREHGRREDGAFGWARPQVTRRLSPPPAPTALCDQMRSPAEGASQMRGDS